MIHKTWGHITIVKPASLPEDLPRLVKSAGLEAALADCKRILLKPNLVESLPPPVTTPVDLISELVDCLRTLSNAEIVIGEGTGALDYETWLPFEELGYSKLAEEKGVELIDLNTADCIRLADSSCRRWPEMFIPKIAMESFVISVPVLKAHTLAGVTLTMKNMMGMAPPEHYQKGGAWKKSSFHTDIQDAIADLNRYRTPDFTILDARRGMAEAHLYGPECDPPPGLLAASFDPVAIDSWGAGILGYAWREIGHIRKLHGELGKAEPLSITFL